MKTTIVKFSLFIVLTLLTACGGGGSSSGPPPLQFNPGVYSGTQTLTLSAPGVPSDTVSGSFSMSATETTVTIIDADFNASGLISRDGNFSASVENINLGSDGLPCTAFLSLTYTGRALGSNASGSITGTIRCSAIPDISISGSFQATTSSAAKQSVFGIQDTILDKVQSMQR